MSELHWVLLLIAAVLLLGVYLNGKWQERKAALRLDASMRRGVGDPLASAANEIGATSTGPPVTGTTARRIEPRLGAEGESAVHAAAVEDTGRISESANRIEPSAYGLADGWVEDPMLDFVLELRCAHPIDGVTALEARSQLERMALELPTHLAVWDARAQHWTGPDRFGFYSEILIAVQLANRRGHLGEIDAARFVAAAQQIAVSADADFDGPDMPRLLAQAAELDRLCARFDVQVTLTLESSTAPWPAATLESAAVQEGLTPAGALRWESRAASGRALAMLASESPTDEINLVLDAPLASAEPAPLNLLFSTAANLSAQLNARVVDDNGRPVQTDAELVIEAQLAQLHADMRAAGIEPGSLRAQRLYAR